MVGYLNFSSGTSDPKFLKNLNAYFRSQACESGSCDPLEKLNNDLKQTMGRLRASGGAFADTAQAEAVVTILSDHFLPAYRQFHQDLLFHQEPSELCQPFFLGRAYEAILSQGTPWNEVDRIVAGALQQINDFVGYRPVATLESGCPSEPYPHEFFRPIPLYIRGAGVAVGKYERIIEHALNILANTDEDLLARAWFDLDRLEEIALDSRAYDFDHPVNRRPNYHFGQWDPHHITSAGYYSRFVLQQVTLDGLLSRCENHLYSNDCSQEECELEAASVLAGTMLMAAGTSGDGPSRHDSTVTLSTLLPHIAAYRDAFYEKLVSQIEGHHGERLRAESQYFHQPFGAARQYLNQELARRRALQMQRVHLAYLYARLGYPDAAQRQADSVRVPAARMLSEIYCRLTAGHDAIDNGELARTAENLHEIVAITHRAIECGALVDPWNVVGFAGNFSLFPALENSVHDWRVDELIELVEQVLDLTARAWSESAAIDDSEMEKTFSSMLASLTEWWDQFATYSVEGVNRLVAKEIEVSANLVAGALNAWHKAGAAAGDIGFWRMFVDQFDNSKAFELVIEALLDHGDTVAAMALMMQWVSQKDRTPLEEGESSFRRLAFRWLATVEEVQSESGEDRWPEVARFFAYLEANAEEYWNVPSLLLDGDLGDLFDDLNDVDYFEDEDDELDDDEEEDEEEQLFGAAYEEMVYRDTTDDGNEGEIYDEAIDYEESEWEYEVQRLDQRLYFLSTVANLWKHATIVWGRSVNDQPDANGTAPSQIFQQWLTQGGTNYSKLIELLETVHRFQFALPTGSHDSLMEYDRLRTTKESLIQQIITTSVELADAARLLAATVGVSALNSVESLAEPIDLPSVQVLQSVLAGDPAGVRAEWDVFAAALASQPLLYVPHSRGGEPRQIVNTRCLQHLLNDLLGWLPQLGLIRETCQLLQIAQDMESNHPVGQGAVTEFDRLFENGYQAIVRSMIASAEVWDDASADEESQHADHLLIDAMQLLTEQQLDRWLQHSRTLRLSVVEKLAEKPDWERFVAFIKRFGRDLFDMSLMSSLGNLRGILHQGVDTWLECLEENPDAEDEIRLLREIDDSYPRNEAVEFLTIALEAVVENYRVYRDYNTTTTQSDHGEQLYMLVDFLRLRATYDRVAWNLKPVIWAHEILIRNRRLLAAEIWCQAFAERTTEAADAHIARLEQLSQEYGMRLATIADRIAERFVRPLLIDRVKALVEPALTAEGSERQEAFDALEREIASLAEEPSGAGLDLPDWLSAMEDEVTAARSQYNHQSLSERLNNRIGQVCLTWDELLQQLGEEGQEQEA
ncbi:hypothetical protein Pla144_08240 [Bythopirellula polymerisocia]|uniref:Uncharacterized protein n=2 Tax=Bythopirellula polymerisocia TaxID=2528003 RepID=A0A5C6D012_9BACT|nr:hypothetical protein Pla144_08240 [Bythopirellula polymerisocia]